MRPPCRQGLVLDVRGGDAQCGDPPMCGDPPLCKCDPPMSGDLCLLSAEAGERGAMCFNTFPAMVQTAVPHVMRVMRDH